MLALREEILVECSYEKVYKGKALFEIVKGIRQHNGDVATIATDEFRATLRRMVNGDGLLEPWLGIKNKKTQRIRFVRLEDISEFDPVKIFYRLTFYGNQRKGIELTNLISSMLARKLRK